MIRAAILLIILVSSIYQNAGNYSDPLSRVKRLQDEFCQMTPMQEEGPYFVKNVLHRSDIRDGKPGIPLNLTIKILDGEYCTPMSGFRVDIWHCDALGGYSEPGRGASRGWNLISRLAGTLGLYLGLGTSIQPRSLFLRGYQTTDRFGTVNFQTIVPGWYPGRSMHVHFEVRTPQDKLIHVGQFYFDESLSQLIESFQPYSGNPNPRTSNEDDRVFSESDGDQTTMEVVGDLSGMTSEWSLGVDAMVTVPLQLLGDRFSQRRGFAR